MYRVHIWFRWIGVRGHGVGLRTVAAVVVAMAVLFAGIVTATGMMAKVSVPPLGGVQPALADNWQPSYGKDVEPIFDRSCVRCHGPQRADKGLRLDSFQHTMAGDSYGTVVVPGDSSLSALVSVLKYGTMPHGGSKLAPGEIETISRWIDAGAKNE